MDKLAGLKGRQEWLDYTYARWKEEAEALPSYAPYRDALMHFREFLAELQDAAPDE